jgi:predicted dehydrogenase
MAEKLRVGVIGASGIGQHHARWYDLCGCEVAAIVGTTAASCKDTKARLASYFGFSGRTYTDVAQMLAQEAPDIVDVSSPYEWHREHAVQALRAGAHVVCEKPMCWDEAKPLEAIVADGAAVVAAARDTGRLLSVSSQYPAVLPTYRSFYERVRGAWGPAETLSMEMETRGRRGPKHRDRIWIDMGSHPISLVIAFLPDGKLDQDSVRFEIAERENRLQFDYVEPGGRCRVDVVLRDIDAGVPARRFGVNGFLVDWDGYADDQGIYRARLTHGSDEVCCDDFLHLLIRAFVEGVKGRPEGVIVPGEVGLRNLELQAGLLRLARQV